MVKPEAAISKIQRKLGKGASRPHWTIIASAIQANFSSQPHSHFTFTAWSSSMIAW
jgi:hypothetical protein